MQLFHFLLFSVTFISSLTFAQDSNLKAPESHQQKHQYQSDVTRLRKIVINSLYSNRDVFLRELISNANDALEKLRLVSLTNKQVWDGFEPLNITIKAIKDTDGKGGSIIISDTGIGMTSDELINNLGTLAKSGTTEFLNRAEHTDGLNTGNLIGAFGLGFYSSFLVADRVYVASVPAQTSNTAEPVQYIFSSSAEDNAFEVYPDPRGNTIRHGTEITLVLKEDAYEFLERSRLQELINKHSSFSSTFPIYLFNQYTEEVPDVTDDNKSAEEEEISENDDTSSDGNDDVVVVEELEENHEGPSKTKLITMDEWLHLNPVPPAWQRDPKNVSDEEYGLLYQAMFKDYSKPLAWHHFAGDFDSGISFKAIIYIPSHLDNAFWQQNMPSHSKDIRLMVKRVFITNDLGEDPLPKWASWVKVVIDADDLPLNVSRETLQSTKFLQQIKQVILKHLLQLLIRLAEEDEEKFQTIQKVYGSVIKLGAVENIQNREKLATLARFNTNQRNKTSLDQYIERRKQGQKQIFYHADLSKTVESMKKSVFVEKLDARGYEVFLLDEPLDEILFQNLRLWRKLPFQDVAKAGLKFGDEDLDVAEEKEVQKGLSETFAPLLKWLKNRAGDIVRDVVISNRLVTSPCAIVADAQGMTANVEKLLIASSRKLGQEITNDFARKQKVLEINPKSPLIKGLLRRIEQLSEDDDVTGTNEAELEEVASILIDGALIRSGFEVSDSTIFFSRIDRVLRRSLGVSEVAKADDTVKPAPPIDDRLPEDDLEAEFFDLPIGDDGKPRVVLPDHLKDKLSIEMEELPDDWDFEDAPHHDEL